LARIRCAVCAGSRRDRRIGAILPALFHGEGLAMLKIAVLLYIIVAPTLMGVLVAVTLVIPALANGQGISAAAILGAVAAAPVSWLVARAIRGKLAR